MDKSNLEKITALRHELHAHPELSGHEVWTKRHLMDFLEANTNFAVVDCGKFFFAAHYREGTDAIAFRADFDALPIPESPESISSSGAWASQCHGVSHKCGHDGHSAALCGLALELEREFNTKKFPRSVYLIFQHAEEIGQGGAACAEILNERNITEVYAFHNREGWPEGTVVTRSGLCQCASKGLTVRMTGQRAHASAPEKGKNPTSALAQLALDIQEWLTHPNIAAHIASQTNMLMCTIVNVQIGTRDFGIAAGEGEISMTLRADRESDMDTLEAQIRKRARELADASDLEVDFEISDPFPETVNELTCVERVKAAAGEQGLPFVSLDEPWRGSEDFGWYTKKCPGAIFYLGSGETWPALHTQNYDFNDRLLPTAVGMFKKIYDLACRV